MILRADNDQFQLETDLRDAAFEFDGLRVITVARGNDLLEALWEQSAIRVLEGRLENLLCNQLCLTLSEHFWFICVGRICNAHLI